MGIVVILARSWRSLFSETASTMLQSASLRDSSRTSRLRGKTDPEINREDVCRKKRAGSVRAAHDAAEGFDVTFEIGPAFWSWCMRKIEFQVGQSLGKE